VPDDQMAGALEPVEHIGDAAGRHPDELGDLARGQRDRRVGHREIEGLLVGDRLAAVTFLSKSCEPDRTGTPRAVRAFWR
jgi:hypothetical protein